MLLWYIEIDFCIEGVDMKKVFAFSFSVIFIFALVVICFAHPGGTDSGGGHYDSSAGEYHYHHGYSAHQHEDGICPYDYYDDTTDTYDFAEKETTEKEYALGWLYIEVDSLEDVIFNEFKGEEGEEIRDVLVFHSDCEILEIGGSEYIEYDSLRDVAMNEYGEYIADMVTGHPDLIKLTSKEIVEKYGTYENDDITEENIAEHEEENEYNYTEKKEKSYFTDVIDIETIGAIAVIGIFLSVWCLPVIPIIIEDFKNKKK